MPFFPQIAEFVWLALLVITFGGLAMIQELRTRHGVGFSAFFAVFIFVVGLIWWDENIEWYQSHKDVFGRFYNFLVTEVGLLPSAQSPSIADQKIRIVAQFYRDLGRGDGANAANLVVPEKRNVGPFSANALSSFFGSLQYPLSLQSVEETAGGSVRANYTYRQSAIGQFCRGRADVDLTNRNGLWLIQGIRANC